MLRQIRMPAVVLAALLVTGVAGCKGMGGGDSTTSNKTLYERLGGHPAIVKVVDDFVAKAASDPKVNFFRKGHPNEWKPQGDEVAVFKTHLVQFIEANIGGPKNYQGKDMTKTHTGMQISESEWAAAAADLESVLDANKVPAKEHAELMKVVASTHDTVVGL